MVHFVVLWHTTQRKEPGFLLFSEKIQKNTHNSEICIKNANAQIPRKMEKILVRRKKSSPISDEKNRKLDQNF